MGAYAFFWWYETGPLMSRSSVPFYVRVAAVNMANDATFLTLVMT